ncbi:LOW QUALITY PROTEIN: NLR family CARD domain-containing protein 3-like [Colossoma macropomum]|uniref:LOW QUALITY PROTEIN: NLR family CARD domain-containing protein 3-like n=1 Tax=Colossoma macropomum TaxID=42526 RepID=UPI00186475F1|nr:LOW QUALITY PROTEIN: NLR family CARD domain-containing protein 3-like [Colossoma macropomum]
MNVPQMFTDGDPTAGHSPIKQEKSGPPEPSCVSMKSDSSMNVPLMFSDRDPTSGHRPDLSSAVAEVQENFKLNLKKKFQYLSEVLTHQGNQMLLTENYTELYITDGDSGGINNEHEVRQIEAASRRAATRDTQIKCNDIFKPLSEQDKAIKTVLTKGVAGIKKTVLVQKFILDWAEGKANQDVDLIFPLPFRELNVMKDGKLMDFLHTWFEDTKDMELSHLYKFLFIFDGLDECLLALDFQSTVSLHEVTESASVDVLLTNLIKGNLLPSALIWITSRPAAVDQVPFEHVDRVTEVRGFTDAQKEKCFMKRIGDEKLAERIILHLKSSRSLYIMCHIPVFCWILAIVLKKMLAEAENREIPKTLTEMYTHFLIIQMKIIKEKYSENQEHEEILLKLGQLAFQQLMKGHLIFYEKDLRKCGINVTEASVYSGVCMQIFREEFGLHQSKVYCFVHLSVQEHLAALYVHLTFMNQKRNVLNQNPFPKLNSIMKKDIAISDVHKSAVDQALESKNGHLDLFLRFLLGLSVESNQTLLQGLVRQKGGGSHSKDDTVQYIKKKIRENPTPEKFVNLFHCLNELDDSSLLEEIQNYLQSGNLQTRNLSPSQWSAVVFVLLTSSHEMDVFNLQKYTKPYGESDEVLLKLMPVVTASRTACLLYCNITYEGCATLASALRSKTSHLRDLNLSGNKLGDLGVKLLSAGLGNPHCKLETLGLKFCMITAEGCAALASALRSNPSHLRDVTLSSNKLGDSGLKLVSAELENPHCKLEILKLWACNVTDEGCAALASALKSKHSHLRELYLSQNDLGDSGVRMLSVGLESPHCRLETLWLQYCKVTDEGCAALVSALRLNPSHLRVLDLSGNYQIRTECKLLFDLKTDKHFRLQEIR